MKLPRLQMHLSTLLIVTVLAAGLMWLNLRERSGRSRTWVVIPGDEGLQMLPTQQWGWPFIFQWRIESEPWRGADVWVRDALLQDVAVCLSLLAVATVAIEWLTRRMKRGAP